MRVLTVRQPWAWAIIHGGKTIENRTAAWSYRGPVAIHAGAAISKRGLASRLVAGAWHRLYGWWDPECVRLQTRVILGVIDLVGIHHAHEGCCDSPWAEQAYVEAGGKTRRGLVHLELENPISFGFLTDPITAKGRLGLWRPEADLAEEIAATLRRIEARR
jgi:hypothetical protein